MMCVSVLAIDLGMVMTARNQAQNSADAGALAGAIALGFEDYSNRTASGPAVQNALNASLANQVMGTNVSITSGDVTFPNDAALSTEPAPSSRRRSRQAQPDLR